MANNTNISSIFFFGITKLIEIFCSVVGAVIIAIGFYTVTWGKAKEEKILQGIQPHGMESSSHNVPLL